MKPVKNSEELLLSDREPHQGHLLLPESSVMQAIYIGFYGVCYANKKQKTSAVAFINGT